MKTLFLAVVIVLLVAIFALRNRRDPRSMRWRSRLVKLLAVVWLGVLAYSLV
ncbi:MAG: hypothetical protein H0T42_12130 [Deltaproteobacteria bacterium]|nr:hypothetical protein [Deltaproteobacteria bacterium]